MRAVSIPFEFMRRARIGMKRVKKLILNTIVLTVSALVVRTIGLAFNAYITGKVGAAGMGLFGLIMTVYSLGITFASSGIRTATTRLIVSEDARGGRGNRAVMRRCIAFALFVSVSVCALMFVTAPFVGRVWIDDVRTVNALRILAFSLPFIAVSATLSGYFLTKGSSVKMASIQMVELVVRIVICVALLTMYIDRGIEYACAAIAIGSTVSELCSCLLAWALCSGEMRRKSSEKPVTERIFSKVVRIAVPEAFGAWIKSILITIEHVLIPSGLKKSGSSADAALASYGLVSQMAFPLLLYPSCSLTSLSTLLIPEIARSHTLGNHKHIRYMAVKTLRLALIFSFGVAGLFCFFSEPLALAVYGNTDTAVYLRLFAPLIPVMYIDMTVDGILKGLDQQVRVMRISILDAALSALLVWILVPRYALAGYLITIFAGEIVNFYLSLRALLRIADVRLHIMRDVALPILCICAATLPLGILFRYTGGGAAMIFVFAAAAMALYYVQLRMTSCID